MSLQFLDPTGQDTLDFPPKSDSVELTARAVSQRFYCKLETADMGCSNNWF